MHLAETALSEGTRQRLLARNRALLRDGYARLRQWMDGCEDGLLSNTAPEVLPVQRFRPAVTSDADHLKGDPNAQAASKSFWPCGLADARLGCWLLLRHRLLLPSAPKYVPRTHISMFHMLLTTHFKYARTLTVSNQCRRQRLALCGTILMRQAWTSCMRSGSGAMCWWPRGPTLAWSITCASRTAWSLSTCKQRCSASATCSVRVAFLMRVPYHVV